MGLVFASIAPHGSIAIAEWCSPEHRSLAARTRAAFEDLGRRFDAAKPDATVLLTPHHVHVEGHMAVVRSSAMHGVLEGGASSVELRAHSDPALAGDLQRAIVEAGIPVVGVSYGANDHAASVMPMDWATQVPIHFMGGRMTPPVPIVMVAPARDLSWNLHVAAGRAIAKAAAQSGKRVALSRRRSGEAQRARRAAVVRSAVRGGREGRLLLADADAPRRDRRPLERRTSLL